MFRIYEQHAEGRIFPTGTLADSRAAADALVRSLVGAALTRLLEGKNNLAMARDHRFEVRALQGAGHGLVIDEVCESRPCPWLGDPGDYTGSAIGRRLTYQAFSAEVEVPLTHGTYDPDDDPTKTPERGYGS